MEDYTLVKNDFNEIAELEDPKWNHNDCYKISDKKLRNTCLSSLSWVNQI
jgi:hypothetical protein